jgi:hypothetical protein
VSATRHLRRRRAHLAAVVAGLAFCAPAATAMAQPSDVGTAIPAGHSSVLVRSPQAPAPVVTPSPDARDAAIAATSATPAVRPDPRSPDARDAALTASAATPAVRPDPRSPDARDAADPVRGLRGAPVPAASSVVVREDSDTTLPLALAGAALAFALLAAAGVGFTARSRRQPVSVGH